jgi:hypothetical protein
MMGLRGSGKTKHLVEMITNAAKKETGVIIAIERGPRLDTEIHARLARLIDTNEYGVRSYQVLRGFITGLYAGNFDITHIFIDSLFKVVECDDMDECERFVGWLDRFGKTHGIDFSLTISADVDKAGDGLKPYII